MSESDIKPRWQPLGRIERRIVGVLIEKAKTTPDQYPLSLNGLVNGCNQKSNRSPQMSLAESQVEDALVRLRESGAVGEVQGSGRVPKYRHYMKDWLGVDGVELAVMAELLLRGDQSVGDLRGRANRMTSNEIKDVAALRPVLANLFAKKLIVALTPAGRGQIVTHALYRDEEMDKLRQQYGTSGDMSLGAGGDDDDSDEAEHAAPVRTAPPHSAPAHAPIAASAARDSGDTAGLRQEVDELRQEVARLRKEVEDLWSSLR